MKKNYGFSFAGKTAGFLLVLALVLALCPVGQMAEAKNKVYAYTTTLTQIAAVREKDGEFIIRMRKNGKIGKTSNKNKYGLYFDGKEVDKDRLVLKMSKNMKYIETDVVAAHKDEYSLEKLKKDIASAKKDQWEAGVSLVMKSGKLVKVVVTYS